MKIAAMGDLHIRERPHGQMRAVFTRICIEANVLLLCGDLTDFGQPEEARALAEDLSVCSIPVLAVLGNHDFESGHQDEVRQILKDAHVIFIDEEPEIIGDYGFAGVKGFAGGFGNHMFASFGEPMMKQFVAESVNESLHLENLLRTLTTEKIIVVLHYSPVPDTLHGEPIEILPVLGSSRLAETIDRFSVTAVFHGHAHYGQYEGKTPKGIPVYNCAFPVIRRIFNNEYTLIQITERGEIIKNTN